MDCPPWPETLSNDPKMAIQELLRLHRLVTQLQIHLQDVQGNYGPMSIRIHTDEIMKSIMEVLSMLDSGEIEAPYRNPATIPAGSSWRVDEWKMFSGQTPVLKDRKVHKRRRTMETWTQVTATPYNDGHAWRKYGQKEILGAKYQRSYFRCTHNDQGCEATKRVQRKEDDPSLFLVTYERRHTCRDLPRNPELILDSPPTKPFSIDFKTPLMQGQEQLWFSSFSSIKQETHKEIKQENCEEKLSHSPDNPMWTSQFHKQENYEEKQNGLSHVPEWTTEFLSSSYLPAFGSYESELMPATAATPTPGYDSWHLVGGDVSNNPCMDAMEDLLFDQLFKFADDE